MGSRIEPDAAGGEGDSSGGRRRPTRRRSKSWDEDERRSFVSLSRSPSNHCPSDLRQQRKTYGDNPDNMDALSPRRLDPLLTSATGRRGGSEAALDQRGSEAVIGRRGSEATLGRRGSEVALLSFDDEKEWAAMRRFAIIVGRRREWASALALCGFRVRHACDVFDEVWWPLLTAAIAPEVNRSADVSLAVDPAAILCGLGVPSRAFLQRLFGGFDGAPTACSFGHFLCATWHFAMAADDELPGYLLALYDADRDNACTLAEVAQMVHELCGRGGEAELLPDLCNRLFRVPFERVKDATALSVLRTAFTRVLSNKEAQCGAALLGPVCDARAWLRYVHGGLHGGGGEAVGLVGRPRICLEPSRTATNQRFQFGATGDALSARANSSSRHRRNSSSPATAIHPPPPFRRRIFLPRRRRPQRRGDG